MRIVCLMYVNGHLVDEMDILQGTQGNAKDLYQTSGFLGSQFLTVGTNFFGSEWNVPAFLLGVLFRHARHTS